MSSPTHAFTVDVEEYFQVTAFESAVSIEAWDDMASRVEASTDALLELMARHDIRGTFFTLGWVAERYPALVRRIVSSGHELASHGYWHQRIFTQTPDEFREDVRRSRDVLEQAAGVSVLGYRAPSFSLVERVSWAYDVLIEEGFAYDSSAFPISRKDYGRPDAPSDPHVVDRPGGTITEFPLATFKLGGRRLPGAGGAYLRLLPPALVRRTITQHEGAGKSAVLYIHPWELDPDQPRLDVAALTRIRHYGGLAGVATRLDRLFSEFSFGTIREVFATWFDGATRPSNGAASRVGDDFAGLGSA